MINRTFLLLAFVMCCFATLAQTDSVQVYLQQNKEQLDFSRDKAPSLFDDNFYKHSIFLFGENHGSAEPQLADLYFFKTLYANAGVRTYISEVDGTKAWMLNNYLKDGQEDWLKKVFTSWIRDTAQWANKEHFEKYKSLRQFYLTLPADEKFRIIGIDLVQDYSLLKEHLAAILALNKPVKGNLYLDSLKTILDTVTYSGRRSVGSFARRLMAEMSTNTRIAGTNGKNHREFARLVGSLALIAPGVSRDSIMFQNLQQTVVADNLAGGKLYGFLGLFHCLTTGYNGQQPLASLLQHDEESYFQGAVVSIIMNTANSTTLLPMLAQMKTMMPAAIIKKNLEANPGFGQGRYLSYNLSNDQPMLMIKGIENMKAVSNAHSATLFRLDGPGSPYKTSRLSGEVSGIQSLKITSATDVTTDAMTYILLFREAKAATPIQF